jgi:hypothetical protein
MSHPVNDQILDDLANEVSSMTVDELQNAVDKYGISGQTVIDEIVENVIKAKFEERSI